MTQEKTPAALTHDPDADGGSPTVEAVRVWRPAAGADVEFMQVTDTARLWKMYHERYGASLNLRGPFTWRYRRALHDCVPGDVALQQPGETHTLTHLPAPHSCWNVFLAPDALVRAAADLGLPAGSSGGDAGPALRGVQTRDPAVVHALRAVQGAVTSGAARLAQDTHVAALVRALLERCGERRRRVRTPDGPPTAAAVRRAQEYLHAHAAENVSLDALAGAACLSKYYLVRVFTATVGMAPHQYLTSLRLARVKAWLAAGVPVSRAALDAGFGSQAHLHRHFVAAFGLTPGQYARAVDVAP